MAEKNAKQRLFFALWPARDLQLAMHRLGRLQQSLCGGRLMRREGLHMTLLFLGAVESSRMPGLCRAAATVQAPAFDFALQRLLCWRRSRIGFAAPAAEVPALAALVEALQHAVAAAGFDFDRRLFAPHVTLLREVERMAPPREVEPLPWAVRSFALVASQTTPAGSRYCVVQEWPLPTRCGAASG